MPAFVSESMTYLFMLSFDLGAASSSPARNHPVVPLLDKAALERAVKEATAAAAAEKSAHPAPAAVVAGAVQTSSSTPYRPAPRQGSSGLTTDQLLDALEIDTNMDDVLPPVINLDVSNDSSVRSLTPPPKANAKPTARTTHSSKSAEQRPRQSVPEQAPMQLPPPQTVLQAPLAGSPSTPLQQQPQLQQPPQQQNAQGMPQQQQHSALNTQQQQFVPAFGHTAQGPAAQAPPPIAPTQTFTATAGNLAPGNFGPGSAPAPGAYGQQQATYAMPVPAAAPVQATYYPPYGPQTGPGQPTWYSAPAPPADPSYPSLYPPQAPHMVQPVFYIQPSHESKHSAQRAREIVKERLVANEREYRSRDRSHWASWPDDGYQQLHPFRLEPLPHINPEALFRIGLEFARRNGAPPLLHDLSHIQAGTMLDGRAYEMAATLTDPFLVLERFRPGTLNDAASDRPLANLKETLKAWSVYRLLCRAAKPWDKGPEIAYDFVIENDMFVSELVPYSGFYRLPALPQHRAIADFVQAVHSSAIDNLPNRPGLTTWERLETIHKQRCMEKSSAWSPTPPRADGRREAKKESGRAGRDKSAAQPKPAAKSGKISNKDYKRVKDACAASSVPTCRSYNTGATCTRTMNAAGTHCSFSKAGAAAIDLEHACPFVTPAGDRCGQAHVFVKNH